MMKSTIKFEMVTDGDYIYWKVMDSDFRVGIIKWFVKEFTFFTERPIMLHKRDLHYIAIFIDMLMEDVHHNQRIELEEYKKDENDDR